MHEFPSTYIYVITSSISSPFARVLQKTFDCFQTALGCPAEAWCHFGLRPLPHDITTRIVIIVIDKDRHRRHPWVDADGADVFRAGRRDQRDQDQRRSDIMEAPLEALWDPDVPGRIRPPTAKDADAAEDGLCCCFDASRCTRSRLCVSTSSR